MALTVHSRTDHQVTIVCCEGRIIFGEETEFLREQVKAILGEKSHIVLNLAGVRDIDSGGIGTLVSLYASVLARQGELALACLTPRVSQSLRITRLLGLFRVYAREEDAIVAFSSVEGRMATAS